MPSAPVVRASLPGTVAQLSSASRCSSLNTAPGSFTVASSASTFVSTALPSTGLFALSAVTATASPGVSSASENSTGCVSSSYPSGADTSTKRYVPIARSRTSMRPLPSVVSLS